LIVSLPTVIEQGRKEIKPPYETKRQCSQNNRRNALVNSPNAQAEIFPARVEKLADQKKIDAEQGNR
jgi:hypothetical protein